MTLKLILSRHAKSSWKHGDLSDHDRPLNKRGRASAEAIGHWLRKKGFSPDTVLSSTSERTRETYDLMGFEAKPDFTRSLYLASAPVMLDTLRKASGETVLMLGHNPGTGEMAERLAKKLPKHSRFLDYPTCATTVFEFQAESWADVRFGEGKVLAFTVPRDLI
ncbi:MAG: histidine phosphatase family protein [Rhodobacteraceae bacterium]|nr:histidine phosphatase family protein [Paracoccaceae bacterium]